MRQEEHVALLRHHACLVAESRAMNCDNRDVDELYIRHGLERQSLAVLACLEQLPAKQLARTRSANVAFAVRCCRSETRLQCLTIVVLTDHASCCMKDKYWESSVGVREYEDCFRRVAGT